jgi:RNA polymerase sigma-70 factor (ECF subfamily)
VRAWMKLDTFEGRASFRSWLYSIVTHLGLDMIERRGRRTLPPAVTASADGAHPRQAASAEPLWLEPLPDALLADEAGEPETRYLRRESVTLAFLVFLQTLPGRQRAIFLLRDVLDWQASEVAELLDTSAVAVESALHRARAALARQRGSVSVATISPTPADGAMQATLQRYIRAWEDADIDGLIALLRNDATLAMPPLAGWYAGRAQIAAFLAPLLREQQWRLLPVGANAQPAHVSYQLETDGRYHAAGVSVLTIAADRISAVTSFLDPTLCRRFALPDVIAANEQP